MTERECKICHEIKPISDFYKPTTCICKRCVCERKTKRIAERNLENNPDLPFEIWRDIPGFEGKYAISNFGRIRSLFIGPKNNCILKPSRHRQGYLRIKLFDGKSYLVHRLVAEAFIPNPENKETINHKNGIKDDNRVDNLEWSTMAENIQHAFKTGLNDPNKREYCSNSKSFKLSVSQVNEIRNLYSRGMSQSDLSNKFGISKPQVCRIVNFKTRTKGLTV